MHMDMARGATVTSIHGMSYFRVSLFSLSKRCCDVSEASRSFWRTNMSSNLFWRCSGVSQLLPVASWTRLSSNLFWRCSGVSQLLCVASWTRLSSNLFWRCSGVSQLLCVASWTRLSSNLFWRCSGVSQLLCVASWNTYVTSSLKDQKLSALLVFHSWQALFKFSLVKRLDTAWKKSEEVGW